MSDIQKLHIDDGLVRLDINGNGLLCFNASDFNLYNRFLSFARELPDIEKKYHSEVESGKAPESDDLEIAGANLDIAEAIDREVKTRLSAVFGSGADFDKLLGGVNCMSFGGNGERIITNLLEGLKPYLEKGVKQHLDAAAAKAKSNREQRRAMNGKAEQQ